MTYPQWARYESIVSTWIPILIIIGAITLIGGAVVGIYGPKKSSAKKWTTIGMFGTLALCIALGFGLWAYAKPYNRLHDYVTPRIRVKSPQLFSLTPASASDINTYSGLNDWQDLDKLPMYQRHVVTQNVQYHGYSEKSYYFVKQNRLFDYSGKVQFTGSKPAHLYGYTYTLKDRRYRKLGFIDPSRISTIKLVLPFAAKKKSWAPKSTDNVTFLQTAGGSWTTEKYASMDNIN